MVLDTNFLLITICSRVQGQNDGPELCSECHDCSRIQSHYSRLQGPEQGAGPPPRALGPSSSRHRDRCSARHLLSLAKADLLRYCKYGVMSAFPLLDQAKYCAFYAKLVICFVLFMCSYHGS